MNLTEQELADIVSRAVAGALREVLTPAPLPVLQEPEPEPEPITPFFDGHKIHAKFDKSVRGQYVEITHVSQDGYDRTLKGVLCKSKAGWIVNEGESAEKPVFRNVNINGIKSIWLDGKTYQPKRGISK